jgi:glutamate 5-kinase
VSKAVQGRFNRGEVVACVDEAGQEVARGLVNYDAEEAHRIKGQSVGRVSSPFSAISTTKS